MNFIKNNLCLILVSILLSFPLCAMDADNLLQGKFLIKNIKHKEFLFVADSDRIGGDRAVEASPGIFSKSIFTFEKDKMEGYRIRNLKHGEYLFVADSDRTNGNRTVESNGTIKDKSYFTFVPYTEHYFE